MDWADRRAVFSLCKQCRWTAGELGRHLGVHCTTVTAWWDKRGPQASVLDWSRLSALAWEHAYEASMLLDDYLWPALARAAAVWSGLTRAAFASTAGCHDALIRDAVLGHGRLNRHLAYYLMRAAGYTPMIFIVRRAM